MAITPTPILRPWPVLALASVRRRPIRRELQPGAGFGRSARHAVGLEADLLVLKPHNGLTPVRLISKPHTGLTSVRPLLNKAIQSEEGILAAGPLFFSKTHAMKHYSRLFFLFLAAAVAISAAGGYRQLKKIFPFLAESEWDYLTADSDNRRDYTFRTIRKWLVLDLDTHAILGKIPGEDVHGIAIVKDSGRGYISATDPGSAIVFDLKTFAVITKVTVGGDPNAIFSTITEARCLH